MSALAKFEAIEPISSEYPEVLFETFGQLAAPSVWACGNMHLLKSPSVGFCGSRRASDRGLEVAADSAEQFARGGVVVVSGYAKGVDTIAHRSALESGGATIIVLPEGADHFRLKQELRDLWDWNRILVISQFAPNAVWRADRAMERNKLIVSLSDATIVIEAGDTGGTLNAGMTALKLGRPIFVANYSSMEDTGRGNAMLLKAGAQPINRSKRTNRAELSPVFYILDSKLSH